MASIEDIVRSFVRAWSDERQPLDEGMGQRFLRDVEQFANARWPGSLTLVDQHEQCWFIVMQEFRDARDIPMHDQRRKTRLRHILEACLHLLDDTKEKCLRETFDVRAVVQGWLGRLRKPDDQLAPELPLIRALLEHAPQPVLEQIGHDLDIARYRRGLPEDSRRLLTDCINHFNRAWEHASGTD